MIRLAAVSLLALAGCASYNWTKEGASPEEVQMAQQACQQVSARPSDVFEASARARMGPGVEREMRSSDVGAECMRMRGYTLAPAR